MAFGPIFINAKPGESSLTSIYFPFSSTFNLSSATSYSNNLISTFVMPIVWSLFKRFMNMPLASLAPYISQILSTLNLFLKVSQRSGLRPFPTIFDIGLLTSSAHGF